MDREEVLAKAWQGVIDGEEDDAVAAAEAALAAGIDPLELISAALSPAMARVGEYFAAETYGLPEVVCAAGAMQQALAVLEPEIRARNVDIPSIGTVVIGTVQGDIHDIGKHIVATMLGVSGFKVHDLGKDVPIDAFVRAAGEQRADVVGCSAMMTTTMLGQQALVEALQAAGLRQGVKVIVGGSTTSQSWADRVGADGWAENANDAVVLAKELVADRAEPTPAR